MSKIIEAIQDGTAKELQVIISGSSRDSGVRWVVEHKNKYYIQCGSDNRYFPLKKSRVRKIDVQNHQTAVYS